MALSGSMYKSFARHRLVLEWSATQNIPENKSTVTTRVYLQSMDAYGAMYAPAINNGSVTVNGQTHTFRASSDLQAYQKKLLSTNTTIVPHLADGTKTFNISATFYINVTFAGTFYGNQTTSGTGQLNTIPRASTISLSSSTTNFGSPITININKASNDFTHTLVFKWSSRADTPIATRTTSSAVSYTPNIELASWIPNETSGWGTVVCDTYNGNTKIGTSSAKLTISLANSSALAPIITSLSVREYATDVTSKFGSVYVQGKSRLRVDIEAVYQNGASFASAVTTIGSDITVNGMTVVSNVINQSGQLDVRATVKDSRGASSVKSTYITVVPYKNPSINFFSAERRDNAQEVVDFSWNVTTSPVNGRNNMGYRIQYRKVGGGSWTTVTSGTNSYQSSWVGNISKSGFNVGESYEFQIEAYDSLMTTSTKYQLSTATVPMSWGKSGTAIGKVYEEGKETFQVRGSGFYEGNLKLANSMYKEVGGAINANDSDIVGLNGIYFGAGAGYDPTDEWGEGLLFPKSSTYLREDNKIINPSASEWDNFRIVDGVGYLNGTEIFSEKPKIQSMNLLWSGAFYMRSNDVISGIKPLSQCPTGWILRWQHYTGSAVESHNYQFTFIPKFQEGFGGGLTHIVYSDGVGRKYLYTRSAGKLEGAEVNYNETIARRLVLTGVYEW